jgi:hypothetical protein
LAANLKPSGLKRLHAFSTRYYRGDFTLSSPEWEAHLRERLSIFEQYIDVKLNCLFDV